MPSFRQTGDTLGFEASHFRVTVPFSSPITSSNNLRKTAFFSAGQQIKIATLPCRGKSFAFNDFLFGNPKQFLQSALRKTHPYWMILAHPCFIVKVVFLRWGISTKLNNLHNARQKENTFWSHKNIKSLSICLLNLQHA